MPQYLAEKILGSRSALEGERKQVTVLFADLKGSMELLADRDPEEARKLLDPVLERMMESVHHYEGTVNQVMGDGIMALFGAPVATKTMPSRLLCGLADAGARKGLRRSGVPHPRHYSQDSSRTELGRSGGPLDPLGPPPRLLGGRSDHSSAARMEQLASPGPSG